MNSSWVINVKVLTGSVVTYNYAALLSYPSCTRPSPPCPDICVFLLPPGLVVYEQGSQGAAQCLKTSLRSPALPVAASASWHPWFCSCICKAKLYQHTCFWPLCTITHVYIITLHHITIIIYYVFVFIYYITILGFLTF